MNPIHIYTSTSYTPHQKDGKAGRKRHRRARDKTQNCHLSRRNLIIIAFFYFLENNEAPRYRSHPSVPDVVCVGDLPVPGIECSCGERVSLLLQLQEVI